MTPPDTSPAAVERLIQHLEANPHPWTWTAAETLRALLAEREALKGDMQRLLDTCVLVHELTDAQQARDEAVALLRYVSRLIDIGEVCEYLAAYDAAQEKKP